MYVDDRLETSFIIDILGPLRKQSCSSVTGGDWSIHIGPRNGEKAENASPANCADAEQDEQLLLFTSPSKLPISQLQITKSSDRDMKSNILHYPLRFPEF